ncbi:TrkH family potassium uptake protein [Desulfothermus sp.]
MKIHFKLSPYAYPMIFFALVIFVGAFLLHMDFSLAKGPISWVDALFTATSATCVTGLIVVDTGTFFTRIGQIIILSLIQIGGLGIMTITSLIFYLWSRRISLTDRIAVGQGLLHDPTFSLGSFLIKVAVMTFVIEGMGSILLYLYLGGKIDYFSALFHSISAFCNAGFSLYSDSLVQFRSDVWLNFIIMSLIILGGLGFSVLQELYNYIPLRLKGERIRLSWHTQVVLSTTFFLIIGGSLFIFLAEYFANNLQYPFKEKFLLSIFQSVTCRTAGFNTVSIGHLTNVSLFIMIMLMFIGGAPGSCAGGIKVTTFRTILAYARSQIFLKGKQAVIGNFAVKEEDLNKAIVLFIFASGIIFLAVMLLNITEGGDVPHVFTRGLFLEVLFEATSAFGTVGLSTGLTPHLSLAGKLIIITLMFIGRLGPILFLSFVQHIQEEPRFFWPEENILIG